MKAGSHLLKWCAFGKKVTCDLLNGKVIEWYIIVQSVDHPVSPSPGMGPNSVFFITVTVGIARGIEPDS